MKNIVTFLLVNLAFILANVVGAGVLVVGHALLGDSDNILGWLAVGITAVFCAFFSMRVAIETCRGLWCKSRLHSSGERYGGNG